MKFTISEKTEEPNYIYQYLSTASGSLVIICGAMHFGWPSPSLPQLLDPNSKIPITNEDGSWLASITCIGAALGSLSASQIVDRIGRKTCLLSLTPIYIVTWLMIAFAPSVPLLYAARFIAGAIDGAAFTAFPMYIGEISSPKIRGLLCSSIQLSMVTGVLLINIIGAYLDITASALVSLAVPVLFFSTFYFAPNSPYYLVMRNRQEEARATLQKLNGKTNVDQILINVQEAVKNDRERTTSIWNLFTIKDNRRAVIILFGIRGFQQLTGVNVIGFYSTIIFMEAGVSISPNSASIIFFSLQLIVVLVASSLVDRLGRKPLLIFSIICSSFALLAQGLYFYIDTETNYDLSNLKFLPLVTLSIYVIVFFMGMGSVPTLMLGEMFPTSVKAFALGLAEIWSGIIVTIVSKFFQIMKDDLGMYVPFFAFAGFCVFGLIFIIVCVPETKGKTLEEIQQHLKT